MKKPEEGIRRILVVDDEETILFALKQYLNLCGYEVDCAGEMEEAEAMMANVFYSVVVMDLCLTRSRAVEGIELVRYVRQNSPATRVIVMTAYGGGDIETEARRRGADVFLLKPQALSKITQAVSELLLGEQR